MAKAKSAVPEGFHTVTPQLTLDNAAQAIDWYKKALGAEELGRAVGPDGIIRDLSDEGRAVFGAPSRVAFAEAGPRRGWLYVADSSQDKIVPLIIPRIAPNLAQARPPRPARRVGG